jgi:hypothetical protein
MSDEPLDMQGLAVEMERLAPSSLAAHLDPTRPYDGQPHTVHGDRGRQEIHGITMRDLQDAFVRSCFESSGLSMKEWPGSVYDLPDLDLLAVGQNLSVNVEKAMGIYPNIPRLYPTDPTQPHWCGPDTMTSVWTSHEGQCTP